MLTPEIFTWYFRNVLVFDEVFRLNYTEKLSYVSYLHTYSTVILIFISEHQAPLKDSLQVRILKIL